MLSTRRCFIAFFLLLSSLVFSSGGTERGARVLTTTSWTAAFVRAAGVDRVRSLAPYEMQHPAEYELRPSDIEAITTAELVVYAGYEGMVSRLRDIADGPELLSIVTDHSLETIELSVRAIAEATGNQAQAERNISAIRDLYSDWREDIAEAGWADRPVVVHAFQRPLAAELGLQIVGVFGPAPLEATQIRGLAEKQPALIIDNTHNPVSGPLTESVSDARVVEFRNFPETVKKGDILDVLESNRAILEEVLSK